MTCQWRLNTYMPSWSTTVMRPTPLAYDNRRMVGPMLPSSMTSTDNGRSLCWPNTTNASERRSWREYREIWSVQSCYLLRHPHSIPPLSKSKSKTDKLVLLPPQPLNPVDDNVTYQINPRPILVTPLVLFALSPEPVHLLLQISPSPLPTTPLLFKTKI